MLAQTHSKKWQKSLQYERDQRIRLEETLEQLAKQHNHLERAFRGATVLPANSPGNMDSSKGRALDPAPAGFSSNSQGSLFLMYLLVKITLVVRC